MSMTLLLTQAVSNQQVSSAAAASNASTTTAVMMICIEKCGQNTLNPDHGARRPVSVLYSRT